ncbi:MAG TPA: 2-oxo acid dehydrogenase subunit E2 [Vicinamibacterales bacterium]|nr:2-oxo acid dehydrogenase subunit E2 [Vicinamibacterales bacterium]
MPTEFKLPELGENVSAGDVLRVLVKPGDAVQADQPVLELETDKATIEVPSSVAGTVREVRVKEGQKVKVGETILTLDESGAGKAKAAARSEGPKPQPAAAPEQGGLSQKAPGQPERPSTGEGAAAAAAVQETAQAAPRPPAHSGQRLPEDELEPPAPARPKRGEVVDIRGGTRPAVEPALPEGPAAPAAPSVRRIARELGVEIGQIAGSGPGGRITTDDVQGYVREALAGSTGAGPAEAFPDFEKWGDVERKPVSNVRRKTAEHLGHAWNVIPHVTQHDRADITALEALRKQYGPQAEKAGGKLTMTAIALKVVAGALRRFPQFASSIDPARGQIVYKKYVHVGVAVDTDRGLLVPVIRDVDRKGILDLAVELAKASDKARAGKLSLEEMSGGVFTISNLGGIGGTSFTPVVNWPEVAILGISRARVEPAFDGDTFQPRLMLPLSLSYDHRMIDGADAARFVRWVAEAMEQPFVLAL